jgi:transcriptional regulator with XRE-family HTH domain
MSETRSRLSDHAKGTIRARALSGFEVARRAGLSPSVVNYWLKGQRSLSLDSFERICDVLGLGLSEDRRRRRG